MRINVSEAMRTIQNLKFGYYTFESFITKLGEALNNTNQLSRNIKKRCAVNRVHYVNVNFFKANKVIFFMTTMKLYRILHEANGNKWIRNMIHDPFLWESNKKNF